MKFPVLIYDNLCSSCTSYAKNIDKILKGQITMIGHYTQQGREFKEKIFKDGYQGLEMSWFVTKEKAFGGRAGLKKLIGYIIIKNIKKSKYTYEKNSFDLQECTTDCKTVKGVMFRSCSLITMAKEIEIESQ